MGALFGFTGPPCPKTVARMDATLRHRGRGRLDMVERSFGTLGARSRWHDRHESFLWSDDERGIALCGALSESWDPVEAMGVVFPRGRSTPVARDVRESAMAMAARLQGAFVVALLCPEGIFLARDAAGLRSVYYGRHGGRWYFAIEPKGVLSVPGFPRRIRPGGVAQYLAYSFVPGSSTMLEDLFEFSAGHGVWLDIAGDDATQHPYTFFETEETDCFRDETPRARWIERVRSEVGAAVRARLPRGEPVGAFLSGGLDSSVVVAELARQHDAPVRTYSIHFGPEHDNELSFARLVAERTRTEHHEVEVRPRQFLPRMREIIWHLDDPIGDPITVPNFELSRRVAEDTRWVFNGEGGDPLFGGPKNIPMLVSHWYGGVEQGARARAQRYLASYRRAYDDWRCLLSPEFRAAVDPERDLEAPLRPFFETERPRSFLNKLSAINIRLKGAHLILPKVERMTGASGLMAHSPLFDERLIATSFAMPQRLKLAAGIEKVVLKEAYRDALPAAVVERPKSGMRVPVHHWFRREMSRYARRLLSPRDVKRAGVFDPQRVQQLLRYESDVGLGRYGLRLWMLMTFELWRRIVVEGEGV